ncbi:MAG: Asp-tRNA(Asn)/Glu-tRNA(Gln) amidotransferase subunit GatB [Planctomycetota bacterium]|nr:Asp-tRNA(Asn)/Glu-tRNA(Gln) amidotransferase subunit GatB [Planctomycetota bacterium]
MSEIRSVQLKVGLEVHVELATRTKMWTRVASPAHPECGEVEPNTLIDPVVLALPGALPVANRAAVEMSMLVGLALGCRIAPFTKWDRKSYFYPDLPKNYQISQYDLPLCADGSFDLEYEDGGKAKTKRVGIIRAHLEEDAGKLLHEWPGGAGGRAIDYSIVDYNRAGTPLLEIVTQPDFEEAGEVVAFAQTLRNICRFLGVTQGIMQKGQMRFEPNINTIITLDDGRTVATPIVEIKNLNSFRSLERAIEYELAQQPVRWRQDGKEMGPGAKSTRGWDDDRGESFLQREKEDAHDYRYFSDPDLLPVRISAEWVERVRAGLPELPQQRRKRYASDFGIAEKEAAVLVEERAVCDFFERAVDSTGKTGLEREKIGKTVANLILQYGMKRANERDTLASELGISPEQVGQIALLREEGAIGSNAADEVFGALCESDESAEAAAKRLNLIQVTDTAALEGWVDAVIADPANAQTVEDVRGGKMAAIGRLVGGVMKQSGGQADAKKVQEMLRVKLGVK